MQDSNLQISFIPKKPLAPKRASGDGTLSSLFLLISVIIFVASGLILGGAYLWKQQLVKQVAAGASDLIRVKDSLESEVIVFEDLVRFNKKIEVTNFLINQHKTIRPFLALLGESTLKTVRFRNLNYKILDSGGAEVRMNGEAASFNSVAQQSANFAKTKKLSNIVFSNLNVGRDNMVVFDFSTALKDSFVSYVNFKEGVQ